MTKKILPQWQTLDDLEQLVRARLQEVMDPELHIDIVSLGLIYDVTARYVQVADDREQAFVHILLTLTTPGCPLAGTFDGMIRDSLQGIPQLDIQNNVDVELTFDPPWVPDMMDPEARAELDMML